MAMLIITEKTSQAKDLAAALGSRYGKILPAEGPGCVKTPRRNRPLEFCSGISQIAHATYSAIA